MNKKCEACGSDALVKHECLLTGDIYFLCRNCEIDFIILRLNPNQIAKLLTNGHTLKEFMLHSDFYDPETYEALQPKC